tara:strand:- start:1121 stop:1690 length:570 start_codon:yes stop_codon:yes gene_type:complete
MIGIAGLARSGKDTLAKNLAEVIEDDWGCEVKTFSFAKELKSQLDSFLKKNYGISAFTEDTEEKKVIRDLLVCHGETMKKFHTNTIWADIVIDSIDRKKYFPIVSDVRFDFEVKTVQDSYGKVIHIKKLGNKPPNEIEAINDPLVRKVCDLKHSWPCYEPDKMHECKDHAQILWQMLKQCNEEEWKIYN